MVGNSSGASEFFFSRQLDGFSWGQLEPRLLQRSSQRTPLQTKAGRFDSLHFAVKPHTLRELLQNLVQIASITARFWDDTSSENLQLHSETFVHQRKGCSICKAGGGGGLGAGPKHPGTYIPLRAKGRFFAQKVADIHKVHCESGVRKTDAQDAQVGCLFFALSTFCSTHSYTALAEKLNR